ncbi:hypothetical protein EK21DRAFT_78584 [Setomelanomma holmii]|uniref:Uncharacterized protein n=1 Tax=Setomelanomma holmii TaxID=210430 RepID=A0A9P4GYR9_9PLEO|nr:hypothetical protein EK21DRAFT_78584 [Setomelanomma holmii]
MTAESNSDTVMTSESVVVPPSPGPNGSSFTATAQTPHRSPLQQNLAIRSESPTKTKDKTKDNTAPNDRTGAGIKKKTFLHLPSSKPVTKLTDALNRFDSCAKQPFRFMDLPGEVRNMIYRHTCASPKQALLVHRPRNATLRSSTRMDRSRPLRSDIVDQALNLQLNGPQAPRRTTNRHLIMNNSKSVPRESNRPFWGLTQVCHQIRQEYCPVYLAKQEIGMDLTEVVQYLTTFYFNAASEFSKLDMLTARKADMPFNGNLTIAVGDIPRGNETRPDGIEVIPLLDLWANSFKIEAGFGRYMKVNYAPHTDGEAKDLYRLFGRRVMRNRQCTAMNNIWRILLRTRSLASVTLHRKPETKVVDVAEVTAVQTPVEVPVRPYIHILFRPDCAEPWMTSTDSVIPTNPDWLADRGFDRMEYFEIKVGVAPSGFDRRI